MYTIYYIQILQDVVLYTLLLFTYRELVWYPAPTHILKNGWGAIIDNLGRDDSKLKLMIIEGRGLMNKNLLVTFENKDIEVLVLDEQILFNPYDVAECLDMTDSAVRMAISKMNEKQVKTVRNSDVKDVDIRKLNNRGENFLTESGLYKLIFKSHKEEAERFQDWVTDEVLPDIRKKGFYMSPDAEDEAIDFGKLFDNNRIKRTFYECDLNDLESLFNQYIELSAKEREAKRLTNKDRIAACKKIEEVLKARSADLIAEGAKVSQSILLQEVLTTVVTQRERLNNKMRGGYLSGKTKKIAQLEEQIQSLSIYDKNFFLIEKHPFSKNYMHLDLPGGKKTNTKAYNAWINNLHLEEYIPHEYPDLDLTKPMKATLLYGHMDKFDTINFEESIIDQVSKYLGFNDKLIKSCTQELYAYVNSYEDGYIYIHLENIEGYDDNE